MLAPLCCSAQAAVDAQDLERLQSAAQRAAEAAQAAEAAAERAAVAAGRGAMSEADSSRNARRATAAADLSRPFRVQDQVRAWSTVVPVWGWVSGVAGVVTMP